MPRTRQRADPSNEGTGVQVQPPPRRVGFFGLQSFNGKRNRGWADRVGLMPFLIVRSVKAAQEVFSQGIVTTNGELN